MQGLLGFERVMDGAIEMAGYLAESVRKRDGFQLVIEVRDGHWSVRMVRCYHFHPGTHCWK
jgi:hypothetical protein